MKAPVAPSVRLRGALTLGDAAPKDAVLNIGGAVVDSSQTDPHFEARDESDPTPGNQTSLPR